jgi:glycosyltransferase involved in cell wall biosynthesis
VTSDPSVAVVVPTYERRGLLRRAVESALDQTRPPAEVVVVDDASSFSVASYLDEHVADPRVVVERFETNRGAAAARNAGVERTNCEYVAFLDSDDYWHEEKLARQMAVVEATPDVDIVYCDQYVVGVDGERRPSDKALPERNLWERLVQGWTAPNTSTLLVDRGWFLGLGGFDESLPSCQDHDLWMRAARSDATVRAVDEPLSYFTRDADDRISAGYPDRIEGVDRFMEKWRECIVETAGERRYQRFARDYYAKTTLPLAFGALTDGDVRTLLSLLREHLLFNPAAYRRGIEMVPGLVRRLRGK